MKKKLFLLTIFLFLIVSTGYSQGRSWVRNYIQNLSFSGMAFGDTYSTGSSTISVTDIFTEIGASAHKSINVDLTYTPSATGAAAPIGIASKLTLTSGMTYNSESGNYQGIGFGIQGQVHFPTGAVYSGAANTDPGMLFAGVRGVVTDAGTSTYTRGTLTAAYFESQVSQDVTSGNFRHFLGWFRNQGSGTASLIDAAIYIDEGDAWTNTIQIGIDMEDVVVGIEIDASETDIILSDDSMLDGSTTSGATLETPTNVTVVNYVGAINQTVITLASHVMTITDAGGNGAHGSLKLITFPEGHIRLLSAHQVLTTLAGAGGISETAALDVGVGSITTGTDNDVLSGTEQEITVKEDVTLSSGTSTFDTINATPQTLDGSAAAEDAWLNVAVEQGDVGSSDTLIITGTITINWMYMGDD